MSLSLVTRTIVEILSPGAVHHGAQHVVGLEARHLEEGQPQGFEQRA